MKHFKLMLTLACTLATLTVNAQYPFGQDYSAETSRYKKAKISGYEKYRIWELDGQKDSSVLETAEIDKNGRITRITDSGDEDQYVYEYFYDKNGQVSKYSWNPADGDDESKVYSYLIYEKGLLISAFALSFDDTISKTFFNYDKHGRIDNQVDISKDYESGLWTDSIISTFMYDDHNRLMEVSIRSSSTEMWETTFYDYTANGRIKSVQTNIYELMDFDDDGVLTPTVMSTYISTYYFDNQGIMQRIESSSSYDDSSSVTYFTYTYH